jgi:hypothetical protein
MRWIIVCCFLTLAASGCIEITNPEVVVTAEPQPEQLEGARWNELPLRYCIVQEPAGFESITEFRALTADAFAAWGVPAVDEGSCANPVTRANGVNEIGWGRPPEAQGETFGGNSIEEAGYARTVFRECRGGCSGAENEIIEVDVLIADDPPERWQNARCLYSTLLHEVGHFLGVPHLDSPAVMAPASATCVNELTDLDIAAVRSLYGE